MKKYIEYICCNQEPSSSSSTKIFCDGEKMCSPCGCYRCCKSAFFNNHTYSILKRICRKIIKNHCRQMCRENYSVFDGGNSTLMRPVFKGQKDIADLFNNCLPTECFCRRNGSLEQKNEIVRVQETIRNEKSNDTWNENMNKRQNSKRPYVSEENNENTIWGATEKFRKGAAHDEHGKKNGETVSKNNFNVIDKGPNKYNKETNNKETKELRKRKEGADHVKDGFKKSAGVKSSDRNNDIDDKYGRDKYQGTTEGRERKNRESKAKQTKNEKNVDQGEINKNEEKEGRDRKHRTSKSKQTKNKKNVEQGEINNFEDNERERDRKHRASKAKQSKNEHNVEQGEINKNEEKEGKYSKNRTSKGKQTKNEKNVEYGEINKYEEKEGKYSKKKTSKGKQTKNENNVEQGEINKFEEKDGKLLKPRTSKAKQTRNGKNAEHGGMKKIAEDSFNKFGKGKSISGSNQDILRENENGRDKNKDNKINKNKNRRKYKVTDESYPAILKAKSTDKRTQNGMLEIDRIALGLVRKNSATCKLKTGSGKSTRFLNNEDPLFRKGTEKIRKSKMLPNKKLHKSKAILGMSSDPQSCRYVRPCDILRVKLEERDLSRCIACCLPYRPYISCSSYQCS